MKDPISLMPKQRALQLNVKTRGQTNAKPGLQGQLNRRHK
jgi:hypothetical protein